MASITPVIVMCGHLRQLAALPQKRLQLQQAAAQLPGTLRILRGAQGQTQLLHPPLDAPGAVLIQWGHFGKFHARSLSFSSCVQEIWFIPNFCVDKRQCIC